jgi:hypothetical protein
MRIYIEAYSFLSGYPSHLGLSAHVELSRISTYVVCNVYQIASEVPGEDRSTYVENALQMLIEWSHTLPSELQSPDSGLSNDRACCELHMSYNQVRTSQFIIHDKS